MGNEYISLIGLAFCGGAFGAAFGALPAFILFGILVVIGSIVAVATGSDVILTQLAFGNIFGPHVAFAGGVAASAFAARKKLHSSNGRDIITPLIFEKNTEPLLIGGLFGVFGFCLNQIFISLIPLSIPQIDTIAATVFFSGVVARILFSDRAVVNTKTQFTKAAQGDKKLGIWLPWESDWLSITFLGAILGLISSQVAIITEMPYLMFGIAAFSLLFLQFGNHVPVMHHIVLPASLAAGIGDSLIFGVIFGVIGALFGELGARLFYNRGDTHIDPPAFAIFASSVCLAIVIPFVDTLRWLTG